MSDMTFDLKSSAYRCGVVVYEKEGNMFSGSYEVVVCIWSGRYDASVSQSRMMGKGI